MIYKVEGGGKNKRLQQKDLLRNSSLWQHARKIQRREHCSSIPERGFLNTQVDGCQFLCTKTFKTQLFYTEVPSIIVEMYFVFPSLGITTL